MVCIEHSNPDGVKAYPDTGINMGNVSLSSLSAVNTSFNFSVPNGVAYDDQMRSPGPNVA